MCDVIIPWAHGTVVRASRYPRYFDFNVVRVEDRPGMSHEALAQFAEEALDGLAHRRVDFDLIGAAEPLREGFEARGWKALRLLWMRYEGRSPDGPPRSDPGDLVQAVPYDAVEELRAAWHLEDWPDEVAEPNELGPPFQTQAREVALLSGAEVLAVLEEGRPVGFAQIERDGEAAEITQVYVHPKHRRRGHASALVRAATARADGARDVWICADDDDTPKQIYAGLGFRTVHAAMHFLRLP
ncbi:MAG: hypothetical protein JWL67_33 [Solirubrobacterales bacterium]|nr:hypothetical protein [Solirubrobacterales bacterium]